MLYATTASYGHRLGDEPPRGRSAYRSIEEWLAVKLRR
jgi:hypothetical protein